MAKNIQVTDEMYEFLMNLSNEINNQDHRGTQMPYFFQVQEEKETAAPDGCGTTVWICDGEVLRTEQDIKEAVFEYKEWDLESEDDNKKFESLCEYQIEEILENNYYQCDVTTEHTYSNAFFTLKACDEHIKRNRHNLNSPVNFLSYAARNPELEKLFEFLCGLTGGTPHK